MSDELKALQEKLDDANATIASLREEAAKHRVARNDALKKAKVLETVVSKHNIVFDMEAADLTSLKVVNGAIEGEFDYEPPAPEKKAPPMTGKEGSASLTMDDVGKMSEAEINKRWDEVKVVLEAQE